MALTSLKELSLLDLSRQQDSVLLGWVRQFYRELAPYRNGDFVGDSADAFRHSLEQRALCLQSQQIPTSEEVLVLCLVQVPASKTESGAAVHLPVGMVSYAVVRGLAVNRGFLSDLYVLPKMREQGIARRLIDYCHVRFQKSGVAWVQALFPPDSKVNRYKSTVELLGEYGYRSTPLSGLVLRFP